MNAIVYLVTNLINGKRYVGITSGKLRKRIATHHHDAKMGSLTLIGRAIRRYGRDMLRFRTLKLCASFDEALMEERRLIALWHPEYNLTTGGDGVVGTRHSEATKLRMSQTRRGRVGTWRGKKRPPEHAAKMVETRRERGNYGNPLKGKKYPREWVERSAARRRETGADQMIGLVNAKPVECVSTGQIFPSGSAAGRAFGVGSKVVRDVCNGRGVTAAGRVFRWAREEDRAAAPPQPPKKKRPAPAAHVMEKGRAALAAFRETQKKRVRCIDDGREFASLTEAARQTGVQLSGISLVCAGRRPKASGLRFEYVRQA